MSKETFYFSHDYNARNDPKLIRVLMKLGHEGKSVYWDLIEILYEQGGLISINEIESIAFALRTSEDCLKSLINDFDLFETDGVNVWSKSVKRRLDLRDNKSQKAKESAKKRWEKMQTQCERNANASKIDAIKESKVKEIKEKEINKEKIPENLTSDIPETYLPEKIQEPQFDETKLIPRMMDEYCHYAKGYESLPDKDYKLLGDVVRIFEKRNRKKGDIDNKEKILKQWDRCLNEIYNNQKFEHMRFKTLNYVVACIREVIMSIDQDINVIKMKQAANRPTDPAILKRIVEKRNLENGTNLPTDIYDIAK